MPPDPSISQVNSDRGNCGACENTCAPCADEHELGRLREAVLAAYNALTQVHADHSRAHNVKYTARAMDVLRAELRVFTDEKTRCSTCVGRGRIQKYECGSHGPGMDWDNIITEACQACDGSGLALQIDETNAPREGTDD